MIFSGRSGIIGFDKLKTNKNHAPTYSTQILAGMLHINVQIFFSRNKIISVVSSSMNSSIFRTRNLQIAWNKGAR